MNTEQVIGIKQVIRLEWMQEAADLLLKGMSKKDIRAQLEEYLKDKYGSGKTQTRAKYTASIAVSMLMNTWVSPKKELTGLRDAALGYLKDHRGDGLMCHWLMYAGAYPFLFKVCEALGAFLFEQTQVLKKPVMSAIYQQYGERSTVERCSRYTIRTLVAWGLLKDQGKAGIYEKTPPTLVTDVSLAALMLEAALYSFPEGTVSLAALLKSPAFFAFTLPAIDGAALSAHSERFTVEQTPETHLGLTLSAADSVEKEPPTATPAEGFHDSGQTQDV